jgi:hypothetical protein
MGAVISVQEVDELYARYGKPFEQEHHGEYAAITSDGRVIVDKDDLVVLDRAIDEFGSGNFLFYRIGYDYVDKVRWVHGDQQGLSIPSGEGHRT